MDDLLLHLLFQLRGLAQSPAHGGLDEISDDVDSLMLIP